MVEKSLFVGPSNESWWKFMLAGIAWKLTRENKYSSYTYYIPFSTKIAMWAFKVRVMSRDFEVQHIKATENENAQNLNEN